MGIDNEGSEIHKRLMVQVSLPSSVGKALPNQLYNPDLVPRAFYLFLVLKKAFRGRPFGTNKETKTVVKQVFCMQEMLFSTVFF